MFKAVTKIDTYAHKTRPWKSMRLKLADYSFTIMLYNLWQYVALLFNWMLLNVKGSVLNVFNIVNQTDKGTSVNTEAELTEWTE